VFGGGGLPQHFSLCCKPKAEEPIVGFITRQHELSIHRANCSRAIRHIEDAPERLVSVAWMRRPSAPAARVSLWIRAYDRQGLLFEITGILNLEQVNVVTVNTRSYPDGLADIHLTLEAHGLQQTSRIINRINTLPNVVEARCQGVDDVQ
jgi:GTP pyrophosphokinase